MTFNSEQLRMKIKWLLNGKVVFCLEKKTQPYDLFYTVYYCK